MFFERFRMKKFFVAVIALVLLTATAYGVAYFVMPVNSAELSRYTHSVSFVCDNAFIVRDETVYYSESDGVVHNVATDGSRVAQDEVISTVYNGDINTDTLKQLSTIDANIAHLSSNGHDSDLYKKDSDSAESQIAAEMETVIENGRANSVEDISETKKDINNARKGTASSKTAKIEALNAERKRIEKSITAKGSDIVSDRSGIFSSYVDGLETVLTADKAEKFTTTYLNALEPKTSEYLNGKTIVSGTPVCKVMDNHVWYIMGIADGDNAKLLTENPNITVSFTNLTETDVRGELFYLGNADENGDSVFIIKVSTYLESAFSYRTVSAKIIFKEYSGYKVPTDSIHIGTEINDYFVYARKGSDSYKCDIDVLYSDTDKGFSIISASESAENNIGAMDRIIVGER